MAGRRRTGRRTASTLVVLLLQLAVCLVVLLVPLGQEPHRAPVAISAPAIVATSLADQANASAGRPVDAVAEPDVEVARRAVERGEVVAAMAIDLRLNRATLFVSSAQGPDLTAAVSSVVRAMAAPFSVDVTTQDVRALPDGSAGQTGLKLAVAGAVILGLVVAAAVTWYRGPVADAWSHAALRILYALAAAAVTSSALAILAADRVGGSFMGWWAVLALTVLVTSGATLALAGVLGVVGTGVATLVFVVFAAPLARIEHPLLLPTPWREVTPWLPHGAALDAARQIAWFDGHGAVRPVVVLLAWLMVSCVVLAVSRRERRRAGIVWRTAATAR